ncbi:hypothetical protein SERLA73DRAFT_77655 [Serpula lacrymans var. lacrymans S7.3]|uniref:Uncharacterized protein n=2 Tax=Serpula lacrymans var. lacrymans TaxID=341189 RepID=F8QA16_SERL3|nr:uncharacterized protein SERLADRAFT_442553 [Serpula lacrymans var. lacrymans S7.9]EGN94921.1 hypothetical protein SERLA73DRAFT_77655 [Serpula lacrymans var. lacrymans S7.3]EGO20420.1 hypothetical protein SERLADRAFT_442553 [Serpula lacrymans var. lacrymans S7.9]
MFGGLLSIKEEEDPGADNPQDLLDMTCSSDIEPASILQDLNIDPTLLQAASRQAVSPVASSSEFPSVHAKRKLVHDLTCEETPAKLEGPMQKEARLTTVSQDLEGEHTLAVSKQRVSGSGSTAIQSFFTSHKPLADSTSIKVQTGSLTVPTAATASASSLHTVLPTNNKQGLTRSQQLFHICSGIDPWSLNISSDAEFYLFMDMRLEYKWTTFGMNSHKWVQATD